MRPAIVRLIDLGLDDDFAIAMSFAQNIVQSLTTRGAGEPAAEIEFIRTRDSATVKTALQNPAHIVHLTAHGEKVDFIGLRSEDDGTSLDLSELAARFHADHEGIEAAVLFVDACESGQGRFTRAVRDCIEDTLVYIGARRSVDWHEATTFASAFYASYFKDKGKGLTPQDRGWYAAERAIHAYEALTTGRCPFVAKELTPSRAARRSLGLT